MCGLQSASLFQLSIAYFFKQILNSSYLKLDINNRNASYSFWHDDFTVVRVGDHSSVNIEGVKNALNFKTDTNLKRVFECW